jgi:hypothetical protein
MKYSFSLPGMLLLLMLGACTRRPLAPVEALVPRPSTYQPRPFLLSDISRPAQLPTRRSAVVGSPPAPAAPLPSQLARDVYERAYQELAKMLDGTYPLSFKRAVYVTENAYFDDKLSYKEFSTHISALAQVCRVLKEANDPYFLYDREDRENVARNAAIFRLMKDTIALGGGKRLLPYRYDFEDFDGDANWAKMFVTKLLVTHSGNCHSLPFLYKMLADETGAQTWLALAPNHIYLKQRDQKDGFYNTELTSYTFPTDGWLMASGYVSKETIVSGIYMDTLSARQSVVLCLVDLAKGYERKLGPRQSEAFVGKCTGLALRYFPNYINAQLLQAETLRQHFEQQTTEVDARAAFAAMETAYTRIYETGYREMPAPMYADWLHSVLVEKQKYQRKP